MLGAKSQAVAGGGGRRYPIREKAVSRALVAR